MKARHLRPFLLGLLTGASSLPVVAAESQPGYVPPGMVAFFSGPSQRTCPPGWSEAQMAQGRLIMAVVDPLHAGLTAGTPLADGRAPTHTHPASASATVGHKKTATVGGSNKGVGAAGSYKVNDGGPLVTDASSALGLALIQYLICESGTAADGATAPDPFPFNSIAFFNPQNSPGGGCPEHWTPYRQADGHFPLVLMPEGSVTETAGEAWQVSGSPLAVQVPTHTHAIPAGGDNVITLGSKGFVWGGGANTGIASPGAQPVSGKATSNVASPVLPVVTLLACQRQFPPGSGTLPAYLNVFYSAAECPDGWGVTDGSPGRFLLGIPGTGTQGLAFGGDGDPMPPPPLTLSHSHPVSGTVTLPEHKTDLSDWLIHDLHLGTVGTYAFNGTTASADMELPVIVLQSCTSLPPAGHRN